MVAHGGVDPLGGVAAHAVAARRAQPRLVGEELVAGEAVELLHLLEVHRVAGVAVHALRRDRLEPVHARRVAADARDLVLLDVDAVPARAAHLRPLRIVGEVAGGAGAHLDLGVLALGLLAGDERPEHRDALARGGVVAALAGDALVRAAQPERELRRGAVARRAEPRVLVDEPLEAHEPEHRGEGGERAHGEEGRLRVA